MSGTTAQAGFTRHNVHVERDLSSRAHKKWGGNRRRGGSRNVLGKAGTVACARVRQYLVDEDDARARRCSLRQATQDPTGFRSWPIVENVAEEVDSSAFHRLRIKEVLLYTWYAFRCRVLSVQRETYPAAGLDHSRWLQDASSPRTIAAGMSLLSTWLYRNDRTLCPSAIGAGRSCTTKRNSGNLFRMARLAEPTPPPTSTTTLPSIRVCHAKPKSDLVRKEIGNDRENTPSRMRSGGNVRS
jgi:hypothetical protein